jgi:4-amino-4-deoxy-L-arabinose transferase-like glycosyltransferase
MMKTQDGMTFSTIDAANERGAKKIKAVPWPVFLSTAFVLLLSSTYNVLVFDKVPHIHDEIAYLFQAQIFLTGHFTAPLPCVPAAFDFPHMVNVGRWYSIYPPGFPFLLSIGLIFGAPWLINPILGAASILLFYFLGVEIYGRRTGILASILGALSIWLILMSATMMSHTASMFFNALALLFIFRSLRSPTVLNGLLGGFSIGAAFLMRPYNAVFFALPFLLVWLTRTLHELKSRWKNGISMALIAASFFGFFLFYNASTTGNALTPGYIARYGKAYSVIFGRAATLDFDYTPFLANIQIWENIKAINSYVFGWPLTSLWLLAFVLWRAFSQWKNSKREFLLFSGLVSMLIGFYFFWGAFVLLGARMFFETLPIIVVLSASGLNEAPEFLYSHIPKIKLSHWKKGFVCIIAVFSLYAFLIRFPRWVAPSWTNWYYEKYDSSMLGSTAWIHNSLTSLGLGKSVVIMKLLYAPLPAFPNGWWGSGFCYDTPRLDGPIIFANYCGDTVTRELIHCFPGRSFYCYIGTLEKGVLVPLRLEKGGFQLGAPLVPSTRPRRSVELLPWLGDAFLLYSPEFQTFIQKALHSEGWMGLDVNRLRLLSSRYREGGDFQSSAFALEAALQIEMNPRVRWSLLGDLAKCYMKLGQLEEAKEILSKFSKLNNTSSSVFFVIPARGF